MWRSYARPFWIVFFGVIVFSDQQLGFGYELLLQAGIDCSVLVSFVIVNAPFLR